MPTRSRTPRIVNGLTAAQADERLFNEYNEVARIAREAGIRNVQPWVGRTGWDNWGISGVRYRARRLYATRQRLPSYVVSRLPTPSVLELLPRDWYAGPQAATSPAALTVQLAPVNLDLDLSNFTFGIEIECYLTNAVTRTGVQTALTAAGVTVQNEMYNHQLRDHWKITTDGSLQRGNGIEIVSPILKGVAGMEMMQKVLTVVEGLGLVVRKDCGFHVHVGARDMPVMFFKNLLNLYSHYETAIDSVTSKSRRGNGNRYARSTKQRMQIVGAAVNAADTIEAVALAYAGSSYSRRVEQIDRYYKVNLASFWRHGTVEFRQHQGTVNSAKATSWVTLCLRIVAAAVAGITPEGADDLQVLAEKLKIPASEVLYLQRRAITLARVQTERR